MQEICRPEKILPAGADDTVVENPFTGVKAKARKGIVAATLNNIALLNRLLIEPQENNSKLVHALKEAIDQLIPSLKAVGIFNLFSVEEWVNDKKQPGRVYVAVLYLKHYPDELTPALAAKLIEIGGDNLSLYLNKEIQSLEPDSLLN